MTRVARIRRQICARCPHPCDEYRHGQINQDEPEAACPVPWSGQWGAYGGTPVAATPLPFLLTSSRADAIAEQGRAAWAWLHLEALASRLTMDRLVHEFRPMIPRVGCGCLSHWDAILADNPLPSSPDGHFAWSVRVHNVVNAELGFAHFPFAQAVSVWKASVPSPVQSVGRLDLS
jgi:hypothetical protein